MPVPAASKMVKEAQTYYGQQLGPDGIDLLNVIFDNLEKAWKTWQNSMQWGGLIVNGAGVGAWSGTGGGGKITAQQQFALPDFVFKQNAPQQVKFSKGLGSALAQKFNAWPATYTITMMSYTGLSGATAINPGPVNAANVSATLGVAGSGQNMSGIADLWKTFLTPPDFQLDNPQAKSEDLVKAISKTIEQSFQTVWVMTTMLQGSTVTTGGAPGGVVAGFTTPNNGKLV